MSDFVTSAAGDRIAYDRYGSGPGVIFIAGAGPSRASESVTSRTAALVGERGLTAIVYDRLGRNESAAAGALTLDRELDALRALTGVTGGHAILVGHSSGCAIALAAAAHGVAADGLVLWEAPIHQIAGGAPAFATEVKRRIEAGDREGALAHYMKDMPPEWLAGIRQSPAFPQIVAGVVTYVADAEALAWAESKPLPELLGQLRLPVETLVGTETFPLMPKSAAEIAAAIPGAKTRALKGAGHAWDPETMAAELVRFQREGAAA